MGEKSMAGEVYLMREEGNERRKKEIYSEKETEGGRKTDGGEERTFGSGRGRFFFFFKFRPAQPLHGYGNFSLILFMFKLL